uniref:Uncharacterized protein n=1 Tax=Populus alba TaxID=43335 RepID=A0A4U5NT04_POPAL|nr:hypothetical protein D5086_0000240860 [Populus alba]
MPLSPGPFGLDTTGSCPNALKTGLGPLNATSGSPTHGRVLVEVCFDDDSLEDERVDYSCLGYNSESGPSFSLTSSSKRGTLDSRPVGVVVSFSDASPCIELSYVAAATLISTKNGSIPATRCISLDCNFCGTNSTFSFGIPIPVYNSVASYPLLDEDSGNNRDTWKLCIIGYVAGKFLGYTTLTKFISST